MDRTRHRAPLRAGQRFLYARSADAVNWTVRQALAMFPARFKSQLLCREMGRVCKCLQTPNVFLPNLTTPGHQLTLEPGPCIHARGRLYCGGSPGFHNTSHDSSAQVRPLPPSAPPSSRQAQPAVVRADLSPGSAGPRHL